MVPEDARMRIPPQKLQGLDLSKSELRQTASAEEEGVEHRTFHVKITAHVVGRPCQVRRRFRVDVVVRERSQAFSDIVRSQMVFSEIGLAEVGKEVARDVSE